MKRLIAAGALLLSLLTPAAVLACGDYLSIAETAYRERRLVGMRQSRRTMKQNLPELREYSQINSNTLRTAQLQ